MDQIFSEKHRIFFSGVSHYILLIDITQSICSTCIQKFYEGRLVGSKICSYKQALRSITWEFPGNFLKLWNNVSSGQKQSHRGVLRKKVFRKQLWLSPFSVNLQTNHHKCFAMSIIDFLQKGCSIEHLWSTDSVGTHQNDSSHERI